MKETLEKIHKNALEAIEKVQSTADVEEVRNTFLSRKSELNNIKKNLKDLSNEDKKIVGSMSNQITKDIEEKLNEKYQRFYQKELNAKLEKERIDITLPASYTPFGKVHPLTQTVDQITEIFQGMGFSVVKNQNSPEVETEYFTFDILNTPKDQQATDKQHTF